MFTLEQGKVVDWDGSINWIRESTEAHLLKRKRSGFSLLIGFMETDGLSSHASSPGGLIMQWRITGMWSWHGGPESGRDISPRRRHRAWLKKESLNKIQIWALNQQISPLSWRNIIDKSTIQLYKTTTTISKISILESSTATVQRGLRWTWRNTVSTTLHF